MSSSVAGSSAPWVSLRLVVAVVMGAPWIICLSMWFVLSGTFAGDETPFPWLFLGWWPHSASSSDW